METGNKQKWIIAACGAVAVLGSVSVLIGLAVGERAAPWTIAVIAGALIIWVLYAVMLRFMLASQDRLMKLMDAKAERVLRLVADRTEDFRERP